MSSPVYIDKKCGNCGSQMVKTNTIVSNRMFPLAGSGETRIVTTEYCPKCDA